MNIRSSYTEVFRRGNATYNIYPKGEACEYVALVYAAKFKDPENANGQIIKK